MPVDAAFANAGKAPGLEIWRIEKFQPVAVPKEDYGKFYSGDSYICLQTKQKPNANSLEWDIFFWLGKTTTQDEMGTAAYKTVELDESLGGGPVQHRETQEHESEQFLSVFKGGVQYLDGGVASGFKKVEKDKYEPRLLHLKGARNVRVTSVPVKNTSLNEGDVFILDLGTALYQWNGSNCSRQEKAKGFDVARKIKDEERQGRCTYHLLDGTEKDAEDAFWKALGGKIKVKSAAEGGDDTAADNVVFSLFEISDASGKLEMKEVGRSPLNKALLKSDECYILDADSEIFVWVGKGATASERKESMIYAQKYLTEKKKPSHTPITRLVENSETPLFKSKFKVWPQPALVKGTSTTSIAKVQQQKVDVKAMQGGKQQAEAMVDDGTGKVEIWRVEDFKLVPVEKDSYGQFFSGDSYIILYTYLINKKENWIIYMWQGTQTSIDERGACAFHAKEMDDARGGAPVQVRLIQNKETNHFYSLFKGKMVVHSGGRASGFKNVKEKEAQEADQVSLYHIRGTNELNTRAVQVYTKYSSLNSGDVFVLRNKDVMYTWQGKGSNNEEKKCAENIAKLLQGKRKLEKIDEGKEPQAFWDSLGGKGKYASDGYLYEGSRDPRMFQCSNATGAFKVEEVFNFSQEDLDPNDVFLLDTYNEIYVWVGDKSNAIEKKMAFDTAIDYAKNAGDGRSPDTPIVKVFAGTEPPMFTCHFLGWDATLAASKEDPNEAKLRALRGDSNTTVSASSASSASSGPTKKYPASILHRTPTKDLPADVDPSRREDYLEDGDFETLFKMKRDEYTKLPAWKKETVKKNAGMF